MKRVIKQKGLINFDTMENRGINNVILMFNCGNHKENKVNPLYYRKQSEIGNIVDSIRITEISIKDFKYNIDILNDKIELLEYNLGNKERIDIELINNKIKDKNSEIEKLENKINKYKERINDYKSEISDLRLELISIIIDDIINNYLKIKMILSNPNENYLINILMYIEKYCKGFENIDNLFDILFEYEIPYNIDKLKEVYNNLECSKGLIKENKLSDKMKNYIKRCNVVI